MTIKGNGATFDTLDEARIKDCDLIIAVTEADELNLYTCLIAKNAGVQRTIARVRNPEYTKDIPRLKDELKVSRLMILAKEVKKQFLLIIHPHSVHTIKMDGKKNIPRYYKKRQRLPYGIYGNYPVQHIDCFFRRLRFYNKRYFRTCYP